MKTYIAQVTFNASVPKATVDEVINELGFVAYSMPEPGVWFITLEDAFASVTSCAIQSNGGEVDASTSIEQRMNISKLSNDVVCMRFGNGESQEDAKWSPYRIEINVAD